MDAIPMLNVDNIAPTSGPADVATSSAATGQTEFDQALTGAMPEPETAEPELMVQDPQLLAMLASQSLEGKGLPTEAELAVEPGKSTGPDTPPAVVAQLAQQETPLVNEPTAAPPPNQPIEHQPQGLKVEGPEPARQSQAPQQEAVQDVEKIDLPQQTSLPQALSRLTDNPDQAESRALPKPQAEPVETVRAMVEREMVKEPQVQDLDPAEPVADPRFSKLLGRVAEPKHDLRANESNQPLRSTQPDLEVKTVQEPDAGKMDLNLDSSADKSAEQLFVKSPTVTTEQNQPQQSFQLHRETAPIEQPGRAPELSSIRLPSGQLVDERRIFDQVAGQIRTNISGDLSKANLRLYPEELGEVRLELTVENDRLRATIQAQTSQVQDVLERHLPRLRDALEQQGLRIESLQVSVDSQRGESSQYGEQRFSEHMPGRQHNSPHVQPQQVQPELETAMLHHHPVHAGQGLSLRI